MPAGRTVHAPRVDPSGADERTLRIARKRFARRQWARRWLVWRRLVVLGVVLAVLAGLGWLFWVSPALRVSAVTVEGEDVLTTGQVRRAAAVPVGEPLASVDIDAIRARVEDLAAVASADVTRSWPDRVRIAVTEREAVAVVRGESGIRGFDADGVLFRRYLALPEGLPVVVAGSGTRAEALAEAARVLDALPAELGTRVVHVEVRTVDTITLVLDGGRRVFWGSAEQSATKAEVLEVLLEQKASTYDVSVPSQPTLTL